MSGTKQRVQIVWAHPRAQSLTAQVVADAREVLERRGCEVDEIDLYRLPFDPILGKDDEPDWEDLDKEYNPHTMELIARTRRADALIFVFPVWWYSLPAIMKGYIDRVWNHGRFYGGGRRIGIDSVLWLGLVGYSQRAFQKRGYDDMMAHYLNIGLAGYCGFNDSRTELLYNTLGEEIEDMASHVGGLRGQGQSAVNAMLNRASG